MSDAARRWSIRDEGIGDKAQIALLVTAAFAQAEHSSGTEAAIVDRLRVGGALSVSLVADDGSALIGHVALSPVTIDGMTTDWFGLGPVAVVPSRQREGIGGALIRAGLERLQRLGATGCVVLGDPGYYRRFGFAPDPALRYPLAPAAYFHAQQLAVGPAAGVVTYHPAFDG